MNQSFNKALYYIYAKIHLGVIRVTVLISLILASLGTLLINIFTSSPEDNIWDYTKGLSVIALALILLVGLKLYINKIMFSSGGKYIHNLKDHFKKLPTHGLFKLIYIRKNLPRFRFATLKETELTAILYSRAFKNTPWDYDTEKRNFSHITKNDHSIMLICTKAGNPIGFTHVIAVNDDVWQRYKEGNIGDLELDGNEIVPKEAKFHDEHPHGIILFTVALSDTHRDFMNETRKEYKKKVGNTLTKAAAHHIDHFLKREFKQQRIVPVLFHTMRDNVIKLFDGHMTNGREYSKDNARLICFNLKNPHV